MDRRILLVLLLAPLGALACQSAGPRYVFQPRPMVIDVPGPGGSGIVARAVVVVLGVRAADAKEQRTDEVALRLSLENLSDLPIALQPEAWKLVSADLRAFGPPLVEPEPTVEILPGAETTVELSFPVLAGATIDGHDLSALNLRFGVRYGSATIVPSATFERRPVYPYDPYYPDYGPYPYGPSSSVSIGVGFSG